jgi:hypothetical protein
VRQAKTPTPASHSPTINIGKQEALADVTCPLAKAADRLQHKDNAMSPFNEVVVLGKVSKETKCNTTPIVADGIEGSRTSTA